MAERRMFSKAIIDSDFFMDLPLSAQALYIHLAMRADDDGFIASPRKIQRMIGASDDDLKLLIAKGFVILFDTGIIVITHWKQQNYIQKDRYKPTLYEYEKQQLEITKNGAYTMISDDVSRLDTSCVQSVSRLDTNCIHSIGKDRLGKDRLGKDMIEDVDGTAAKSSKSARHKYGQYKNVLLSDEDMEKLKVEFPNDWQDRIERLSEYVASTGKTYKNHLATIRNWAKKDASKPQYQQTQQPQQQGGIDWSKAKLKKGLEI